MKLGLLAYIYKFFQYNLTLITQIKSVDLYFNQFETDATGDTDARSNPRVLIEIDEFEPGEVRSLSKHQEWVGEVVLHVGIDIINSLYSKSELEDKNLQYLDLFSLFPLDEFW